MYLFELSEIFRTARIAAGLTQKDVSKLSRISTTTISDFERGNGLDIGVLTLSNMLRTVGLELAAIPCRRQTRTLDDVQRELDAELLPKPPARQRVRHKRGEKKALRH
ncbi:helix-turn-helix domain-containing protein [Sulfurirhabdus autotrophica]|uniref:Helix-turn-helix protein n=1 Tax=Sulfurirhabdus autotrophica TaxID=1706046 RepID=A0A4R3XRX0_9PROT|nr:helix-turn-helix transcriptional regulator [Sulfurirhabdus autotrophica]TCV81082.1 helix-turn-helix protein [Sulfurirhabdus autotrophica]